MFGTDAADAADTNQTHTRCSGKFRFQSYRRTDSWTKVCVCANTVLQYLRILQYFVGTSVVVKENVASMVQCQVMAVTNGI
jgi:hypothetical protein